MLQDLTKLEDWIPDQYSPAISSAIQPIHFLPLKNYSVKQDGELLLEHVFKATPDFYGVKRFSSSTGADVVMPMSNLNIGGAAMGAAGDPMTRASFPGVSLLAERLAIEEITSLLDQNYKGFDGDDIWE